VQTVSPIFLSHEGSVINWFEDKAASELLKTPIFVEPLKISWRYGNRCRYPLVKPDNILYMEINND
jgi:hypothetical protein